MKYWSTILLLIFTTLAFAEKRALVIGIGMYAPNTGWDAINGDNDIALVQEMLQANGFSSNHIYTLKNEQATYENIQQALTTLIKSSKEGDIVYLHFSGHGQQITDINHDEEDGYDEAFIPYDAHIQPSENYHGERHLTDDELNGYLSQVQNKIGNSGRLTVIMDACHSGTGTRKLGERNIRGTASKFLIADYSIKQLRSYGLNGAFLSAMYMPQTINWLYIGACSDKECNRQYISKNAEDRTPSPCGSLSYALYSQMDQLSTQSTQSICEGILSLFQDRSFLPRSQSPQIQVPENRKLQPIL